MAEKVSFVIDLDKPKEELIKTITSFLEQKEELMKKEGQVALNFLVKKIGQKDKSFVYNLNKDSVGEAERDLAFPILIEEIIKKEFNPKVAKNEKLLNHIKEELKKDPYWSNRTVKLLKAIKEKQKK